MVLISTGSFSQGALERVYLQCDKYTCHSGDTVWFKGYVLRSTYPTTLSTNLYVELYTPKGTLLSRDIFPILNGVSIGQLKIPDSIPTNNYYIRAFTRYQLNFDSTDLFTVPVVVFNMDRPQKVPLKRKIISSDQVVSGVVQGITWTSSIHDGKLYSMLMEDSTQEKKKLHLVKTSGDNSGYSADITLEQPFSQQTALFPLGGNHETATLLLYEDTVLIGRQYLSFKENPWSADFSPDTLDLTPFGYNSWQIKFPDTALYTASVSVTDAERSYTPAASIGNLRDSRTEDLARPILQADAAFISFVGKAVQQSGKKIQDKFSSDILLAGSRDSNFLFYRVVTLDSAGNFSLDSLFFFGEIDLGFRVNKEEDGSAKNVRLALERFIPPASDSILLTTNWEDDSLPIGRPDTSLNGTEVRTRVMSRIKTLKPVEVKAWKNPRKELDDRYTSGAFNEPSMYSFDVRQETRFHNISSYLAFAFPGFHGGFSFQDLPEDATGHPYIFFVDENPVPWWQVCYMDWSTIAYIKVLRSDFLADDPWVKWTTGVSAGFSIIGGALGVPTTNSPYEICIYTRKDKDWRTVPGGMNKISVKGYSTIVPFKPDGVTLCWDPFIFGNGCRIRFHNNAFARRFRVVVEGFNYKGEIVHMEKILE